jgi:hypothetical protein
MEPRHVAEKANEGETDAEDFAAFKKSPNGCAEESSAVSVQKKANKHFYAR